MCRECLARQVNEKERIQCRGDEFMSRRGIRVQEEVPSDCEA